MNDQSPIKPVPVKEPAGPALFKREGATEIKTVQTIKERGEDATIVKEDEVK